MPAKCATGIEGGSTMAELKDDFHRNIPIVGGSASRDCHAFEKSASQLRGPSAPGNVRFIAKRGNFGDTVVIGEEAAAHKLPPMSSKYGLGVCGDLGIGCESACVTTPSGLGQRGCLSEKSSDSGVSSSSLSSAPTPRDKGLGGPAGHPTGAAGAPTSTIVATSAPADSPTKNFGNLPRGSPTSQASASKGNNETSTYQ